MIDSFELSTEYSNILKNAENYEVPNEDEYADKDPNELLEGQLSSNERSETQSDIDTF